MGGEEGGEGESGRERGREGGGGRRVIGWEGGREEWRDGGRDRQRDKESTSRPIC